ncbi:MAG TPA: hypothetical protein PLE77_09695 [Kiritimatiellia bacterium]|nr:hypothetical protein [Kiritimatiellia bacterium]
MRTVAVGLLVLIAFADMAPVCAQGLNLLRNGGFEEGGVPYWGVTGTAQRLERGDWHPHTGKWAFGIGNDSGMQDAFGAIAQEVDLSGTAVVGRKCVFTVWLLTEPDHSGSLLMKMEFLDSEGKVLREVSRPAAGSMKQGWRPSRIYGLVPAGATRVRVVFADERMKSGRGQSFVWIDDAEVVVD